MNRRLAILMWIFCWMAIYLDAQTLPIVAVVDNRSIEVEHTAKLLESKLNTALTTAGVHSESDRGLFMVAELSPVSEDVVDTGMKKIKVLRYNLSLRVEYPMLDMSFGTTALTLEGSGVNAVKAAMDAVRKFNPAAPAVQNFIADANRSADQYFIENVDRIINKAYLLAKNHEYDSAIALLWGCPYIPSIHGMIYEAIERLYMLKQNNECANLIAKARTAYSLKKYEEAMEYLDEIDAESECAAESRELVQKIGEEIREEDKAQKAREDMTRERQQKLEQKRLSAITSIATAYLNNQRSIYHYFVW